MAKFQILFISLENSKSFFKNRLFKTFCFILGCVCMFVCRLSVTNRVFNRLKDFEIAYHKR